MKRNSMHNICGSSKLSRKRRHTSEDSQRVVSECVMEHTENE